MKILFLYTKNKSFLASYFNELAEALAQLGHQVMVFSLKSESLNVQEAGVTYIIEKKGGYLHNYKSIYQLIKREQPTVIISNFSYVNPALLFGKLLGVRKNIAWMHTLSTQINPSRQQVWIKGLFLKLAEDIVVNSQFLKADLHSYYNVPLAKMHAIPFWCSQPELPQELHFKMKSQTVFNIGCPGRLVVDKNQQLLIQALSALQNNDVHLYLAGSGENEDVLKEQVTALELQEQVHFTGVLSIGDMFSFYKQMDLIVLPSLHEAFGLVFIEALALGVPVLVSDAFGALGFIDAEVPELKQLVFSPTDTSELANKIKVAVSGHYLPSEFFKSLYARYFDKTRIIQQIQSLIED